MQKTETLSHRWFAWLMRKGEKVNRKLYHRYRTSLLQGLTGTVVEIGPGTGINFNYMPASIDWVGIEPNRAFHELLLQQASKHGIKARLLEGDATQIPLPDNYADEVISTLVLCSVPDQAKALHEIRRILKPGGRLMVMEHVAAEKHTFLRKAQYAFNPINIAIADGCHCNRDTLLSIEDEGFSKVEIQHVDVAGTLPFHRPHIVGYAVK